MQMGRPNTNASQGLHQQILVADASRLRILAENLWNSSLKIEKSNGQGREFHTANTH